MAMRRSFMAPVTAGVLVSLLGCSQVLGIEEATLDSTASGGTGGSTQSSTGGTGAAPPPAHILPTVDLGECPIANRATDQCLACIEAAAPPALSNCLGDPNCRAGLEAYRGCLANNNCVTPAQNDLCTEQLFDASSALGTAALGCRTACEGKAIVSICEIHCSCMVQNCGASDFATCMSTCPNSDALDAYVTFCRWEHCEFARVSADPTHCAHARGEVPGICGGTPPEGELDCPPGRKHSGFICQQDSDCCGECHDNLCR